MQTTANTSLVLTDSSSLKSFADSLSAMTSGRFYQRVASALIKSIHTNRALAELGQTLILLAEHSYAHRQMDDLGQVSQFLMNSQLPGQHKAIGQYYQALCTQMLGSGDVERAASLLEDVAKGAPPKYMIRAIISLAANFRYRGENESALSVYCEAARFADRYHLNDPYSIITAQRMSAVIKSEDGNHRGALGLLENLFPLAHATRLAQPQVYFDYMNSLAVELCEDGRLEEARNVSQIVLASPFAHAYPEWRETLEEIELRGHSASHDTVAVSKRTSEAGNLVCLPAPERQEGTRRQERIPGHTNQQARVFDMMEWKKKMGKEPNGTPQDKNRYKEMDGREMLLRIMELTGSADRTDDELERILEAIERVLSESKETGRQ